MNGLQLIATGGALPGRTVTNEDLSLLCLCYPLGPGRDPERGLSGTACAGPA